MIYLKRVIDIVPVIIAVPIVIVLAVLVGFINLLDWLTGNDHS